jgi:23S rRNA pseudouridine2605 synthase/23S rRNA pseudouridine2604 synthase
MGTMRLQKFLSAAGVCSRRAGETYITAGRVSVNGEVVRTLGTQVDPGRDRVAVDGRTVALDATEIYIALHKPRGYVTSCRHPGERIVLDLVDLPRRVFPVGRLDKESTGLLLLTSDGRIHHRLSHPAFDHEKEYRVRTDRPLSDGALAKLAGGVAIGGRKTRPAEVRRLSAARFQIVLKEGRNRQIRRMVGKVGRQVVDLQRVRVAGIRLGRLTPGNWRHLSPAEVRSLLSDLGLEKQGPRGQGLHVDRPVKSDESLT